MSFSFPSRGRGSPRPLKLGDGVCCHRGNRVQNFLKVRAMICVGQARATLEVDVPRIQGMVTRAQGVSAAGQATSVCSLHGCPQCWLPSLRPRILHLIHLLFHSQISDERVVHHGLCSTSWGDFSLTLCSYLMNSRNRKLMGPVLSLGKTLCAGPFCRLPWGFLLGRQSTQPRPTQLRPTKWPAGPGRGASSPRQAVAGLTAFPCQPKDMKKHTCLICSGSTAGQVSDPVEKSGWWPPTSVVRQDEDLPEMP